MSSYAIFFWSMSQTEYYWTSIFICKGNNFTINLILCRFPKIGCRCSSGFHSSGVPSRSKLIVSNCWIIDNFWLMILPGNSRWTFILSSYVQHLTVIFLSFRRDRSGQIVQTQIRLFLEEQFDQGLHSLQFPLHFWMYYSKEKPSCSTFSVITATFWASEILRLLRYSDWFPCLSPLV